ncbi:hypothetical protein ACFOYU_12665 [Microvirga sp. GCM10011540]|uniref:hypothetical protein n=1 Tax=Microvirga sp. GCM10011540 TaxID=3317338 RepID=UPI00361F467D
MMATLSPKDYFDLASWTYTSGMQGPLASTTLSPFPVTANHYQSQNNYDAFREESGFYGAAYMAGTGSGRVILIGFEGTNVSMLPDHPEFAVAQILADADLYYGRLPQLLDDALTFTQSVIDTARTQGILLENIFITGHSLGAAAAQYVAAHTGLGGVTYGGPGISSDYVPDDAVSGLTNYVERGDPVGNYTNGFPAPVETYFLYSDKIEHFGTPTYLGNYEDAALIISAGLAFASTSDEVRAAALATFYEAAEEYHLLNKYHSDLPSTSDAYIPEWMSSYTGEDLARIISGVLGDGEALVDDVHYYVSNPDVFHARLDPEQHYAKFGAEEGRDPNAFLSTVGYLAVTQDEAAAGFGPIDHYKQKGWKEGVDPGANFDNERYLAANPDVEATGVNPLSHYLQFGRAEGRQAYSAIGKASDIATAGGFDAQYYLLANPDVAKAALTSGDDTFAFAADHFERFGWHEHRNPNAVFDTKTYLAAYADVQEAGINPLQHYMDFGWKEGRDPSSSFDTTQYLASYADVAAAQINPMMHYLRFGAVEGRNTDWDGFLG